MRVFLTLILAAVVSPAFAADLLYHNRGIVTNAQVDAVHFLNEGQFFVNPFTVPWDSQNTLTFTNRGLMSGNIGFRFDTVTPPFGRRTQAQSFFNSGTILAQDGGGTLPFISGDFVSAIFAPDISYVSVN